MDEARACFGGFFVARHPEMADMADCGPA